MKRYYVEGNVIRVVRYIIDYSINKDTKVRTYATNGKICVNNSVGLEEEKQRLERQGAEYTVTEIDVSDILKFDGALVGSEEEARKLIEPTLEEVKAEKIKELTAVCQETIFNGIDVTLTSGETKHFSLKIEDQMNLNSLFAQVSLGNIKAEDGVPYHADGEICSMFNVADFTLVANAASAFKVGQTTYCNHLMSYVKSLGDVGEVRAVIYGQELTGKFLESYQKIMGVLVNE